MPGIDHLSIDAAVAEAGEVARAGHPRGAAVRAAGAKDEEGSGAWDDEGIVQLAMRAIKAALSRAARHHRPVPVRVHGHGHCGVLRADGVVDNDATLELLARTAVSQAAAGADVIAPSDMMDGRVGALRAALDDDGCPRRRSSPTRAKFASAFYGPFREAADSAPAHGDRRGYQMDPANAPRPSARPRSTPRRAPTS